MSDELDQDVDELKRKVAGLSVNLRWKPEDEHPAIREQLRVAKRDYQVALQLRAINKLVAEAPPLSETQISKLRSLFGA